MDKIGIFINNTINKKNIEINYHNLLTLYNKFDKVYISDNNNKHSKPDPQERTGCSKTRI